MPLSTVQNHSLSAHINSEIAHDYNDKDNFFDSLTDDVITFTEPPEETCLNCQKKVSVISLREHMVSCNQR